MTIVISKSLVEYFENRLQQNVPLAGLTTAKVGGPARFLLVSHTASQLAEDARRLWDENIPFRVFGSGANMLVSDQGLDELVIHNLAKEIVIEQVEDTYMVKSESGAALSALARMAARNSLTGLEWASTIPGTLGGAVYGNAGAHGGNMQGNLVKAEIMRQSQGMVILTAAQMGYSYRSSLLKRSPGDAIILSASLLVTKGDQAAIDATMKEYAARRRNTQPPGASMGSIFKNPEGNFAGRLIQEAGLKGTRIGGVEVSPLHGNFMVNDGSATAGDYFRLITLVREKVREHTGVTLELEIELLGFDQDEQE